MNSIKNALLAKVSKAQKELQRDVDTMGKQTSEDTSVAAA